jgi:hypothetical protein
LEPLCYLSAGFQKCCLSAMPKHMQYLFQVITSPMFNQVLLSANFFNCNCCVLGSNRH